MPVDRKAHKNCVILSWTTAGVKSAKFIFTFFSPHDMLKLSAFQLQNWLAPLFEPNLIFQSRDYSRLFSNVGNLSICPHQSQRVLVSTVIWMGLFSVITHNNMYLSRQTRWTKPSHNELYERNKQCSIIIQFFPIPSSLFCLSVDILKHDFQLIELTT